MLSCARQAKLILQSKRSEMPNQPDTIPNTANKAQAYEPPALVTYGNLADLTQTNILGMGLQDGGNIGGNFQFLFKTRP
jgi:hypothetical protein